MNTTEILCSDARNVFFGVLAVGYFWLEVSKVIISEMLSDKLVIGLFLQSVEAGFHQFCSESADLFSQYRTCTVHLVEYRNSVN